MKLIKKYCFSYHNHHESQHEGLAQDGGDQPLEGDIRASWVKMFKMLVLAGGISFRRFNTPETERAVGKCILVSYFDGCEHAYATVI